MVVTGECRLLHTCEMCEFNNETDCKADKNEHNRWLVNKRMNEIKHKLIVGSNKGGVGKSTVTTNLAIALQESGYSVGLADADLHGPNIPKLLQAENVRLKSTDVGIDPYETSNGLKVASLGFLIEDPNMHIAWRDAVKYDFIIELLGNINWGPLDYLLFDLPPGTGNEQITIIDFIGEVEKEFLEIANREDTKSEQGNQNNDGAIPVQPSTQSQLETQNSSTHTDSQHTSPRRKKRQSTGPQRKLQRVRHRNDNQRPSSKTSAHETKPTEEG